MSKKVLMIAYQFPPMGGPGVQRTSKFVKYLPQFGYEPIVYTIEYDKGLIDESLMEDVTGAKVIRTKSHSFENYKSPFNKIFSKVARKLVIPDVEKIWCDKNKSAILKVIDEIKPDFIYTTSYPYSDHLLGLHIKKMRPELPWVADFRDEWTNNPYILDMNYSDKRMKKEKGMEKAVCDNCDAFIANTPLMLEGFLRENNIKDKSFVISNGFDEDDFKGLVRDDSKHEKFVITYSGGMYGRRNPNYFLKAVKHVIDKGLVDKDKILIQFIGNFSSKMKNDVYEFVGYKDIVSFYPYMAHKKSLQFLLNSDLLLLIIGVGKGAKNFYSGKIFEYINTDKTIFAMAPKDGAAASVINSTNTGVVVDGEDLEEIERELCNIYKAWNDNTLKVDSVREEIDRFSRFNLTKNLSQVFEYAKENCKG